MLKNFLFFFNKYLFSIYLLFIRKFFKYQALATKIREKKKKKSVLTIIAKHISIK